MSDHGDNDLEEPDPEALTLEIWRNRVIGLTGPVRRALNRVAIRLGGPWYHLLLVVRHPRREGEPEREVARYEIYEPERHPPRRGDWRRPVNLGGFLQRRATGGGSPRPAPDPEWDLHPLWIRNYSADDPRARQLVEATFGRYRWRDHYPRWWDNFRGRHVNSNTFVEKVVLEFGLENRDGRPIDLTGGGRYVHPGLGRCNGWDFTYGPGDTAALHEEWCRLHPGRGLTRWFCRTRLARRYVPLPSVAGET